MEVIKIYEKIQYKKKIEKLIYITNLTQHLFDNIENNQILFNNGPYKNECIKSYLDKHFNISACILPTSIFRIPSGNIIPRANILIMKSR